MIHSKLNPVDYKCLPSARKNKALFLFKSIEQFYNLTRCRAYTYP